jgi:hypothetical protein
MYELYKMKIPEKQYIAYARLFSGFYIMGISLNLLDFKLRKEIKMTRFLKKSLLFLAMALSFSIVGCNSDSVTSPTPAPGSSQPSSDATISGSAS